MRLVVGGILMAGDVSGRTEDGSLLSLGWMERLFLLAERWS